VTTFTYFAYGSNMLNERLQDPERCPSAKRIGTAVARGYSLGFCKKSKDGSGKAALLNGDTPEAEVDGVLFEIDEDERPKLGKAEGEGDGYDRDDDFKVIRNGQETTATTYLMSPGHRDDSLKPYDWYHALVVAGALQHVLPESYIEKLRKVDTKPDSSKERYDKALCVLKRAGFEYLLEE